MTSSLHKLKVAVRVRIHGNHTGEVLGIAATGKHIEYISHEVYRVEDGMLKNGFVQIT